MAEREAEKLAKM